MNVLEKETDLGKTMQRLLLLAAGFLGFWLIPLDKIYPGLGYFLADKLLPVTCLLFAGSALTRRLSASAKRGLLLSCLVIAWFAMVQLHRHLSYEQISTFGVFGTAYLLAFPFAAVTGETDRSLKWLGGIYGLASLLLLLCGILLLTENVPAALAGAVSWDGARLSALWHPNVGACVFMIGIGFTLYFFLQAEKKWAKLLMALLAAAQFWGISLTNSRTTILLTCAMFAGTVFFTLWNGGWKRFLMGAAAALAVMLLLFSLSGTLFDLNVSVQTGKLLQQAEAGMAPENDSQKLVLDEATGTYILQGNSNQGELLQDMRTLNGRTYIWRAAATAMQDNPSIKRWGTPNPAVEISFRNYFPVAHAHNSWVQVVLELGFPGLLLALVYTAAALWNIWVLMWRKDLALPRKVIVMLTLCLLVAGILEPYLFTGDVYTFFARYMFFFALGCLLHWRRETA